LNVLGLSMGLVSTAFEVLTVLAKLGGASFILLAFSHKAAVVLQFPGRYDGARHDYISR
jgi:hypothetical protein